VGVSSFRLQLEAFGDKIGTEASKIVRKVAFDLLNGVILMTPVDTGRARGSWEVGIGSAPSGGGESLDKGGGATLARGNAVLAGYELGKGPVFIVSNLSYIQALEDGWSDQAPYGMVTVTAQRFPYLVKEATEYLDTYTYGSD
jgi:hypothetical protein